MRQDVGRRSRGVAGDDQPAAHETLREYSRQYGKEIKSAGNPGLETRRRFFDRLGSLSCCVLILAYSLIGSIEQRFTRIRSGRDSGAAGPLQQVMPQRLPDRSTGPAWLKNMVRNAAIRSITCLPAASGSGGPITLLQHGQEMRSVESDLLHSADHERRQTAHIMARAAPRRKQEKPTVNRRVPKAVNGERCDRAVPATRGRTVPGP